MLIEVARSQLPRPVNAASEASLGRGSRLLEPRAPRIYCIVIFQEGASLVDDRLLVGARTVGRIHFAAEKTHFQTLRAASALPTFGRSFSLSTDRCCRPVR
jgi:hypothetical protein